MIHVTHPANIGPHINVELEDGEDTKENVGVAILAVADNVRRRREELHLPNPLAPVVVRVWEVTPAGTYKLSTMQEHLITPQPADIPDWQ